MEVRKLTENEHFEANLISYVAFHMRMEDPEKAKEWFLKAAKQGDTRAQVLLQYHPEFVKSKE